MIDSKYGVRNRLLTKKAMISDTKTHLQNSYLMSYQN